jgi:uncharacterized protein (DUF1330 family)
MIKRVCEACTQEFMIRYYRKNTAKFCSPKCYWNSLKGMHPSSEFKTGQHRSSKTEFKKGRISWSKIHPELMPSGKNNHNWKGGKVVITNGYIEILNRKHPFCNQHGYVREHRLIVEKHIGRYLTPKEVVHHINGDKHNNCLDNLMAFSSQANHMKFTKNRAVKAKNIIFDGFAPSLF